MEWLIRALEKAVDRPIHVHVRCCRCVGGNNQGEMNLAVIECHGRNEMAAAPQILPPIKLLDTEKVLLSISPQNPDGSDYTGAVDWKSSDPASVPLEVASDGLAAYAITPNETGAATITVQASGVRAAKVDIMYGPPIVGEMNLSAGVPVTD